ncbi:MAG: hypothetical protein NVS9B4_17330 [Candidatus Acidiferrum sp.]
MAKRQGHHQQAAQIWHEMIDNPRHGLHACQQLAIHYERRAKDLARAVEFARLALSNLRRMRMQNRDVLGSLSLDGLEDDFVKRVARLEQRLANRLTSSSPQLL